MSPYLCEEFQESFQENSDSKRWMNLSPAPSDSPITPCLRSRRPSLVIDCLQIDCVAISAAQEKATRIIENSEMLRLEKDYETLEVLGQGVMAVVRRARSRSKGTEAALKTVRLSDGEDGLLPFARAEFELLRSLRHPNILRAYDFYATPHFATIVLELFPGPTLAKAVRETGRKQLEEEEARIVFAMLLGVVAYLHEHDVVHRDIKSENVLVSRDLCDLRLIDFNTAQKVSDGGALSMTGTRAWAAPEVLHGDSPGMPADVWGAGLCLHLMLCGRLLCNIEGFRCPQDYGDAVSRRAASLQGTRYQHISRECRETLRSCLEVEEAHRAEAGPLFLSSRWLNA